MRTAQGRGHRARGRNELFAAIDLGTHNCRMLIAAKGKAGGFRIVGFLFAHRAAR